ncbi:phosphorelay sensor kinase [Aureococcus anophagefferens]|nr:phosphorelay sensor kinase [Aureococcus anophagefferens]
MRYDVRYDDRSRPRREVTAPFALSVVEDGDSFGDKEIATLVAGHSSGLVQSGASHYVLGGPASS